MQEPKTVTVDEAGLPHSQCQISTGICESITAGQGKLDDMGYFAFPCPACAARMQERMENLARIAAGGWL